MSAARVLVPLLVVAASLAAIVPLQRWFDAHSVDALYQTDEVYLTSGNQASALALGYDSLLSDVYWVRAIQFFGRALLNDKSVLSDPSHRLDQLYPLIDISTTLDPRNLAPYRFGGFFVHDYVDKQKGRALLEKGVRANPEQFRLYQDLAFLTLSDGDCSRAAQIYDEGGRQPSAPSWMRDLGVIVNAKCGRPDLAVELLTRQYEAADDPRVKEQIEAQLEGYVALGDVSYLQALAERYREQTGQRPPSLAQLVATTPPLPNAPQLRFGPDRAPVDPKGVPYVYDRTTGSVTTSPSGVPLPAVGSAGVPVPPQGP